MFSIILTVVQFVITVIFGVIAYFMKRELTRIERTSTDLSDFKTKVAEEYIRKEDYNREIGIFKKDYTRSFNEFRADYNRAQGEVMKRIDNMQELIIQTIKEQNN